MNRNEISIASENTKAKFMQEWQLFNRQQVHHSKELDPEFIHAGDHTQIDNN